MKSKTLEQRQSELRVLLGTQEGQAELEAMATRYHAASDRRRVEKASIITYIIVHERERGLIPG